MKRQRVIITFVLTSLIVGLGLQISFGQGPLTPLFNLAGRTDSNGYLMITAGVAGAQGPLTPLGNLRGRTDSNGYLMTTISGGTITPAVLCPGDGTTYISQPATNEIAIFTSGTACATGTNALDLSPPRMILSYASFVMTSDTAAIKLGSASDIWLRRSAAKTLTIDTDGAGGALTFTLFKGAVDVSSSMSAATFYLGNGAGSRITDSANGKVIVSNNANTAGVLLDLTSDSTIYVKTRADGDNGVVRANGFTYSGTVYPVSGSVVVGSSTIVQGSSRIVTGTTSGGTVTSSEKVVKTITGISNAAATATTTITVPNAAHSATVRTTLSCSLGAGGAIGANEATGAVTYDAAITRTAGVNAAGTMSTAYGSAMVSEAGAATITVTAALSTVSGAVGATNTFTINVTVSRGSGAATNHTCVVQSEVINANATGVTVN